MLNVLLVTESRSIASSIADYCEQIQWLTVALWLDHYPNVHELIRQINQKAAEVLLMDFSDPERSLQLVRAARRQIPDVVVIGFGAGWNEDVVDQAESVGVDGLLVSPVNPDQLQSLIENVLRLRKTGRVHDLYAFVPAKAGSGTTTAVQHTACMLSLLHGARVLVLECDLRAGLLSLLLNVDPARHIQDAFDGSATLNRTDWERLVVRRHSVQWLLAARDSKRPEPHWVNYQRILHFAHSHYDYMLADLPGEPRPGDTEIMRAARRVFIVTTPDVPALRLAAERRDDLIARGISKERIEVLLNRCHEGDISAVEVESHLELPVAASIPEDHTGVRDAVVAADLIGVTSPIRAALANLTRKLTGAEPAQPKEPETVVRGSALSRMRKLFG